MECINYLNDLILEVDSLKLMKEDFEDTEKQEKIDLLIRKKEDLIYMCKDNLSKLSDSNVCCRLYIHMLNGLNASKAVEKVSEENFQRGIKPSSIAGVWNYYKKMQKLLSL